MQDDQHASQTAALSISHLLPAAPASILTDWLPHIPTMATTRLQLELLLQETTIDLSAVSEVILSDAGATLQILRLIGEEYPIEEDRPTRIEDCLVSLNMERWHEAICASSVAPNTHVLTQWQHFRRVAQCARELAKCVEGLAPEEAYLIGLLCEVGKLPQILGWNESVRSVPEQEALGVMLADYWHLPGYLLAAIREQQLQEQVQAHVTEQAKGVDAAFSSGWGEILQMARQVAAGGEHAMCTAEPGYFSSRSYSY